MLAEGLGLLQGLNMLQTQQAGKLATGFGSTVKWNKVVPGTPLFVSALTGLTIAQAGTNAQAIAALGSPQTPYASLEEALNWLSAPATKEAWETPRTLYVGPGVYTVGAALIDRSLTLVLDRAASITDQVQVVSSDANAHGSLLGILVQFICPAGVGAPALCLPGGVDVSTVGTAVRTVSTFVQGIRTVITSDATVGGGVNAHDADIEVHAPSNHGFVVEAHTSVLRGATFEATRILAWDCEIFADSVVCILTSECRLYSTILDTGGGTWTGGTLKIDGGTNYDWVNNAWVKANPGGAAPVVMT